MSTENLTLKEDATLTERRPYQNRRRKEENSNRKYIKILNQSVNLIDAKIEDYPLDIDEQEGTPITASILEEFHNVIEQADSNSKNAWKKSDEAVNTANIANQKSDTAINTANVAEANSTTALNASQQTMSQLSSLQQQIVGQQGTKVTEGDLFISVFNADKKLTKISNQEIKELYTTIATVVHIGKFSVTNSNISIDITSTTTRSKSAKLVIACSNGLITEANVYYDENNLITPNLYIKASSASDNIVDVYYMADSNSSNIFQIMAVNATMSNLCELVASLPSTAQITPTNSFNQKILELTSLINALQAEINNMKNGTSTFTLLKANSIDLV